MTDVKLDVVVPEELLNLLAKSRLANLDRAGQVRAALAIHLFVTGEISIGKAAELSGENRIAFQLLLRELGIPAVRYGTKDYEDDMRTIEKLKRERTGA
jgi:predicted HTH domain antitoxin